MNKLLTKFKYGHYVSYKNDCKLIASYPKSGNTWVRFMLGSCLLERNVTFQNIDDIIRDVYTVKYNESVETKIFKSHDKRVLNRNVRSIYIVRDPRSVARSYFNHILRFQKIDNQNKNLNTFCDLFLNGGLDKYGTWALHVKNWSEAKNCLFIKYEDILANPKNILSQILSHLELEVENVIIDNAIEASSINHMKAVESVCNIQGRPSSGFVRSENINWFQDDNRLQEFNSKIVEKFRDEVEALGYV